MACQRICFDPLDPLSARQAARWVWVFVILGIAVRVLRYALRFPLWEDECFLSCSLLDRNYLDLTQALDYHEVCPAGFLWVQLTLIKLLGFNEYTLRLLAVVLGVGSLLVFRHLAGRLLEGTPLVIAVALFAVSYPMIRYSAEAKQYGADLFVSLVFLMLAVEWWRRPGEARWLWTLAALAPVGVFLSYPAALVGGGVSLFVALVLWREKRSGWLPWLAFNGLLGAAFAGIFATYAGNQSAAALADMQRWWESGFPPLGEPLKLPGWLLVAHTSDMLAYPLGGHRGGSALTFLLCVLGAAVFWRRRRRKAMVLCLAPLALSLVAAALRRHPYGQMVKFQIYLAPAFCTLAAVGAAAAILRAKSGRGRRGVTLACVLAILAAIGAGCAARDLARPAKTLDLLRTRDFARWFWHMAEFEGEVACLKTDLGLAFSPLTFDQGISALYLCNQRIYSPRHARGAPLRWDRISADRPLRCVEYVSGWFPPDERARSEWLARMQSRYELVACDRYSFPYGQRAGGPPHELDFVEVYKFVPREPLAARDAPGR